MDEDWVLRVYDKHGNAVNITMERGDMVLYERGTFVHGRPFPMKGYLYANFFINCEPSGEHLKDGGWDDIDDFYPRYSLLVANSPWLSTWARMNPSRWRKSFTYRRLQLMAASARSSSCRPLGCCADVGRGA